MIFINTSQRKALSSFFISIAVVWFTAAFVTPYVEASVGLLTLIRFLVNMILALYIALFLLKD